MLLIRFTSKTGFRACAIKVRSGRKWLFAQRVHIIDADGQAWEALYTLEQQPDGSLKITGCSLLKASQAV